LTAEDVVFSLNRLRTDEPRFDHKGLFASLDKLEAPDEATVRVTTSVPDVGILSALSATAAAVLAPEVVEQAGDFVDADTAVGTGAFVLESFGTLDAALVANPDFWRPDRPYLEGATLNVLAQEVLAEAMQTNRLDFAHIRGGDIKRVADQVDQGRDPGFRFEWIGNDGFIRSTANIQRQPFNDERVPRALRLLHDHKEAVEAWGVTHFVRAYHATYLPWPLRADWDFTDEEYEAMFLEFKQPKDDASMEAVALLNAAGFSSDNPLEFELLGALAGEEGLVASSQLLQDQWRRLTNGVVQANVQVLDFPVFAQRYNEGEFDYFTSIQGASDPLEVGSWFRTFHHTNAGRNYIKHSDPIMDELIERQQGIFDFEQRRGVVKELLSYMMENSPNTGWAGYFQPVASAWRVQNFQGTGDEGFMYEDVWLDE
jgi:peptide/nickel transport system substrate-binding protein